MNNLSDITGIIPSGYIRCFEQAGRMGDVLVVTITEDSHVDKGPHRPTFTEALRSEAIASLSCVDYVNNELDK